MATSSTSAGAMGVAASLRVPGNAIVVARVTRARGIGWHRGHAEVVSLRSGTMGGLDAHAVWR